MVNGEKVVLLLDWENILCSLRDTFGIDNMNIEHRLRQMCSWIEKEVGELLEGHGFVFAPEHFDIIFRDICVKLGFQLLVCPKRTLSEPKWDAKSGLLVSKEDTVDETLIWFGELMMNHSDVGCICLVSSDSDFIPFLEKVSSRGIRRALVIPSMVSLSDDQRLTSCADRNDLSNRMILFLDAINPP